MATNDADEEVVILVMGPTGSGKTTFVNVASKSDLRVGTTLQSCTEDIQMSKRFLVKEKNSDRQRCVVLVDSPGFDDTEKSDSEILRILCEYLSSEYVQKRLLQGVIYIHRITDNKMTGTSVRNFQAYQELCGAEAISNSVIASTMWSRIEPSTGARFERELESKDKFFKPAIDRGAKFIRHLDTETSAHDIIRELLGKEPKPLRVQQELVDENKQVFETAAGEALMRDIAKAEQKHQQELLEVRKELEEAREQHESMATQQELEEELARLEEVKKLLASEKAKLLELQLAYVSAVRSQLTSEPQEINPSLYTNSTVPTPSHQTTPLTERPLTPPAQPSSPTPIPTVDNEEGEPNREPQKPQPEQKPTRNWVSKISGCFKSFWKRLSDFISSACGGILTD